MTLMLDDIYLLVVVNGCVCVWLSGFNIDQRTVSAFIGHDIKDFCHVNDIDQLLRHLTEGINQPHCTDHTASDHTGLNSDYYCA